MTISPAYQPIIGPVLAMTVPSIVPTFTNKSQIVGTPQWQNLPPSTSVTLQYLPVTSGPDTGLLYINYFYTGGATSWTNSNILVTCTFALSR